VLDEWFEFSSAGVGHERRRQCDDRRAVFRSTPKADVKLILLSAVRMHECAAHASESKTAEVLTVKEKRRHLSPGAAQ
jgi:hypothetical protein